jgi:hypothetical protein
VVLGRPKATTGQSKFDLYPPEISALLANSVNQKYIAGRYHVTEATLSETIAKQGMRQFEILRFHCSFRVCMISGRISAKTDGYENG